MERRPVEKQFESAQGRANSPSSGITSAVGKRRSSRKEQFKRVEKVSSENWIEKGEGSVSRNFGVRRRRSRGVGRRGLVGDLAVPYGGVFR